jgi:soluble lytic murein transglycosylase-like protein
VWDLRDFSSKIEDYVRNKLSDKYGSLTVTGGPGKETVYTKSKPQLPSAKEAAEREIMRPVVQSPAQGTFKSDTQPEPYTEKPKADYSDLILEYKDKPPFPTDLVSSLVESASNYGIDPNVLASLIASESGGFNYDPSLRGESGEVGLGQVIPGYHYQTAGFGTPEEYDTALLDPYFSMDQAAAILADLLEQYNGDYFSALAAYNAGPAGSMSGYGDPYATATLDRIGLLNRYLPEGYIAGGY